MLATISSSEWEAIGAIGAGLMTLFGLLVKLNLSFRADNKELTYKIMDKAIPALEANAKATEMMINVTQQMTTQLAVMQALKDASDNKSPPPISQNRRRQ